MKTLIKNGTIVTAQTTRKADLLVEDEIIRRIDERIVDPDAAIVDATGLLVLPGGVDPHVHLDLPMFGTISADDHYTGGKAAAFGGTTTMIDFVSQEPVSLAENIARHRAMADPKTSIDYSFHMNITHFDEQVAEELPDLPRLGVTSMKVFTAYNGRLRLDDGNIFKVMRIGGKNNLLTMVHAENGDVIDILVAEALAAGKTAPIQHARTRPAWGEIEASLRAAALAAQNATRRDHELLFTLCDELDAIVRSGKNYIKKDMEFHQAVANCSGNTAVHNLIPYIHQMQALYDSVSGTRRPKETVPEHREIAFAISEHRGIDARNAMEYHLLSIRKRILKDK